MLCQSHRTQYNLNFCCCFYWQRLCIYKFIWIKLMLGQYNPSFCCCFYSSLDTRVGLMLGQRRRRWPNILLVFADWKADRQLFHAAWEGGPLVDQLFRNPDSPGIQVTNTPLSPPHSLPVDFSSFLFSVTPYPLLFIYPVSPLQSILSFWLLFPLLSHSSRHYHIDIHIHLTLWTPFHSHFLSLSPDLVLLHHYDLIM